MAKQDETFKNSLTQHYTISQATHTTAVSSFIKHYILFWWNGFCKKIQVHTQNESIILPQLIFSPLLLQQFARRIYSSRQPRSISGSTILFVGCNSWHIFQNLITPRTAGKWLKKMVEKQKQISDLLAKNMLFL